VKIIFSVVCSLPLLLHSQILSDQRHHTLLLQGIHSTLEQRYDSAETVFRTIMRNYPKHPSGYVYLAGMMQARYTDYGDSFNERRYDSLLTASETLAQKMIDLDETAAWGYYYSGLSDAFRSFTASENGNLPKGFYFGISAGGSLEKCLKKDPNFNLAKNILGSYYFWRSKLAWIPLISDRTDEGIDLILQALDHPYEKHLASHNLMLIFIDEKRYSDAEKYGTAMLEIYPENRSFLWNMVTVYEQWGKTDELMAVVERLLKSALAAPVINRYTEADCRLKIAKHALQTKNVIRAEEECRKIIALKPYDGKTKGNIGKKISQAEDLLSSITSR
jgi:tetratricopeptide (TPR) repeat protein